MKNSAVQGGCYPQRPKAEMDNTLRDLQNSSYPTKAKFNNCFIIHSKYFFLLKGVSPLRSLFFRSPNITQPCPQVFSVNGSIICSGLHFWRHGFNNTNILSKLGEQQLIMLNCACGFDQSERGEYFEWIITMIKSFHQKLVSFRLATFQRFFYTHKSFNIFQTDFLKLFKGEWPINSWTYRHIKCVIHHFGIHALVASVSW